MSRMVVFRTFRRAAALTAVAAVVVGPPLHAQVASASAGSEQAAPAPAPAPPPLQAGFQDGFFIQTANGDNRLVFGMVAQTDGRFSLGEPKPIINTFTIRKLRPTFTGRVAKYFDFKMMPDFGNGTEVVQDAWVDVRFSTKFRVRIGKDKTPVGYELLEGDGTLFFPERALASSLVPNRDIGVQVQGSVSGNKVFYAAGVFNGVPDGTSSTTELDTNSGKDLAGRIVLQPFSSTATPAGAWNGFGFQVGGSTGHQTGALPSFKTSAQQTYFSYSSSATASGERTRVTPAVFYFYKSFGGFAEFMRSTERIAKAPNLTDVTNHAWEVTGSYLLTGDAASYGIIRPKNNFDPASGHWGALQVLARVSSLTVDPAAFAAGLTGANASRQARQFTIAANWYPSAYIKFYATFERTVFDGNAPGARAPEDVVLFRSQLGF